MKKTIYVYPFYDKKSGLWNQDGHPIAVSSVSHWVSYIARLELRMWCSVWEEKVGLSVWKRGSLDNEAWHAQGRCLVKHMNSSQDVFDFVYTVATFNAGDMTLTLEYS